MGKPKNTKPEGCVATSSECVIWEGPDISFLNLCTGDTISTVTKQVADKVCILLNYTSVNSYDFSCIDATSCSPKNFVELLQQVINEICALKEASPLGKTIATAGCPDCEIAVATCFQEAGAVQQLTDYVTSIGIKVCDQAVVIETQSLAIAALQKKTADLQSQIDIILGS